jgi:hypothetical protein
MRGAPRVPDSRMAILHYPLSILHYILRVILLWTVWRMGISLWQGTIEEMARIMGPVNYLVGPGI